jgi:hypothetical protein
MPIELSLWERIGAFDSKSADSRERFSKFLAEQRTRRPGTAPRSSTVDRLTKADTFSNLYDQDAGYDDKGDLLVVFAPDGITAIGPIALVTLAFLGLLAELNDLEAAA